MSKESNVEKTVDDRVIELINDRPYYICKVNDKHTDLQSQLGSIDGTYGREHDRVNEQYLLEGIKALIASEKLSILEKIKSDVKFTWPKGYATPPEVDGKQLLELINSEIATLTQEKISDE